MCKVPGFRLKIPAIGRGSNSGLLSTGLRCVAAGWRRFSVVKGFRRSLGLCRFWMAWRRHVFGAVIRVIKAGPSRRLDRHTCGRFADHGCVTAFGKMGCAQVAGIWHGFVKACELSMDGSRTCAHFKWMLYAIKPVGDTIASSAGVVLGSGDQAEVIR